MARNKRETKKSDDASTPRKKRKYNTRSAKALRSESEALEKAVTTFLTPAVLPASVANERSLNAVVLEELHPPSQGEEVEALQEAATQDDQMHVTIDEAGYARGKPFNTQQQARHYNNFSNAGGGNYFIVSSRNKPLFQRQEWFNECAANFLQLTEYLEKRAIVSYNCMRQSYKKLLSIGEINFILTRFISHSITDAVKRGANAIVAFTNPETKQTLLHYFLRKFSLRGAVHEKQHLIALVRFLNYIRLQSFINLSQDSQDIFGMTQTQYMRESKSIELADMLMELTEFFCEKALERRRELMVLCKEGNYYHAKNIMISNKSKFLCYTQDKDGFTPLYYAIKDRNFEFARLLLEKGAPPNLLNYYNRNILHIACETQNYLYNIESFFDQLKPFIEMEDSLQATPLCYVCREKAPEFAWFLISKEAKIYFDGAKGSNALLEACRFHNEAVVKFLIKSYPLLLNRSDSSGATPLHEAILLNNKTITKLLIADGAIATILNVNGQNVFHIACDTGNSEMIRLIFDEFSQGYQSALMQIDNQGLTPIHYLVAKGSMDTILYLMHKNINFEVTDRFRRTPIHYLISLQKYEAAITILIEFRNMEVQINLNAQDMHGMTFLNLAAHLGSYNLARVLIEMGADLSIANSRGITPLGITQTYSAEAFTRGNTIFHQIYTSILTLINNAIIYDIKQRADVQSMLYLQPNNHYEGYNSDTQVQDTGTQFAEEGGISGETPLDDDDFHEDVQSPFLNAPTQSGSDSLSRSL